VRLFIIFLIFIYIKMINNTDLLIYKLLHDTLNNSDNITDFLKSINSFKNKEKGDILEYLSLIILKEHPYFKKKFKEVYLQKDIPNSINKKLKLPDKDKGIDLLAIDDKDVKYSVQCKYRSDTEKIIPWNELSTFPGLTFTCNINNAIFITNCNDVCKELKTSDKILNIYGTFWDTYKSNNNLLYKKLQVYVKNIVNNTKLEINTFCKPRDYQLPIIEATVNYYKLNNNTKGQLISACGTGKTLMSYFVIKDLKYNNIIVIVSSLLLLSQFYLEWYNQDPDMNSLLIGSSMDPDIKETGLILTTSTDDIYKWIIENKNKPKVIISTYHSSGELKEAISKVNKTIFDVCIFDEAHRTAGAPGIYNRLLGNDFLVKRRLFLTATPKVFVDGNSEEIEEYVEENLEEVAKENVDENKDDDEIVEEEYVENEDTGEGENKEPIKYCMNDVKYYGETIYELNMCKAIEDNILTNYQIITPLTTDKMLTESINLNKIKMLDINKDIKYESATIASAFLLLNSLKKHSLKKILTYHSEAKTGINSAYAFCKLIDFLSKKMNIKVVCEYMDGSFSMKKRKKILNDLEKSEIPYILSSARVLNEGVDIKCIDTVVFVNSRSSIIDIIQCVGRCLRKYEGKKLSNIIIPMLIEDFETCSKNSFNELWKIIRGLCSSDETLKASFILKEDTNKKKANSNNKTRNFIVETLIDNVDVKNWKNNLLDKCWRKCDCKEYNMKLWENTLKELMEYINKNNRKPSYRNKNNKEKILSTWIGTQLANYKNSRQIMINKEIRKKWKEFVTNPLYKKFFILSEEKWYATLEAFKLFLDKNNRRPLTNSEDQNESSLGSWFYNHSAHYITKYGLMENINIRNKWEQFVNDDKYKQFLLTKTEHWIKTLEQVKNFIDLNNRKPNKNDKNERILGEWIKNTNMNYISKKQIMANDFIRNKWNTFINDPKYIDYFVSRDDIWNNNLDEFKKFLDDNSKTPNCNSTNNDEKSLAAWFNTQKYNYQNMKMIAKYYEKWKIFINDPLYQELLLSGDEIWFSRLKNAGKFIDNNNKRPVKNSINFDEKKLGNWIGEQIQNYRKNGHLRSNDEIGKAWVSFIEKYKKYFS